MSQSVRIWDLPTRLFHWLLAIGVIALIVTAKSGAMEWHFRLGYSVCALLVFRLLWGFAGGHWSRFASFLYSPRTLWSYLRGRGTAAQSIGHSPTGALSVYGLLLLLLAQVATGLFSDDEIAWAGPLTSLASGQWVSLATWWHKTIGQPGLIVLIVLHVLAILYYYLRKRVNLLTPMVTGDKTLAEPAPASRDDGRRRLLALVLLLLSSGAVWLMLKFAG